MTKLKRLEIAPDSVVVSRKDLFKSIDDDSQSDNENENISYIPNFEFEEVDTTVKSEAEQDIDEDLEGNEEEGYSFRLFGGTDDTVNVTELVTKVIINDDDEIDSYANRGRPNSYYFYKPTPILLSQFEEMAVTGEDIIKNANIELAGMKMPWKVIDYTALAEKVKLENRKRRSRPGKKTREQRKLNPRKRIPQNSQLVYGRTRTYGTDLKYHTDPKKNFKKRSSTRGGFGQRGRGGYRGGRGGK